MFYEALLALALDSARPAFNTLVLEKVTNLCAIITVGQRPFRFSDACLKRLSEGLMQSKCMTSYALCMFLMHVNGSAEP